MAPLASKAGSTAGATPRRFVPRWFRLSGQMLGVFVMAACTASAAEWNQWGGSPSRNNVPEARNLPMEWAPGEFDPDTGAWQPKTAKNLSLIHI